MPSQRDIVTALLDRHGRTYAEQLRIPIARGTPSPLFRLLTASLLFSARISEEIAVEAANGMRRRGWTSAGKLADSTWQQRVAALNEAGYTRYQERTATMLGEATGLVLERWRGDLRRLRDEAERDPGRERELLTEVKGIGEVGADIFLREVQVTWAEVAPFADDRALAAASDLGLPAKPGRLFALLDRKADAARLTAALVRSGIAGDADEVRAAA